MSRRNDNILAFLLAVEVAVINFLISISAAAFRSLIVGELDIDIRAWTWYQSAFTIVYQGAKRLSDSHSNKKYDGQKEAPMDFSFNTNSTSSTA
jgi:hypothetical protein